MRLRLRQITRFYGILILELIPLDSPKPKSRESAFQSAKENIDKAQKTQKETYDQKHLQSELSVGTKVWLENTAQKERKVGEMEPVWLGPYIINRSLGKGLYELKNDKEIIKKKAND